MMAEGTAELSWTGAIEAKAMICSSKHTIVISDNESYNNSSS